MTAHAQRLKLRCFLEGIEVPIVGIQLQCLPNAPLLAALQLPPVAEGTRLLPRTVVHVFFLDPYETVSRSLVDKDRAPSNTRDPSAYQDQSGAGEERRVKDLQQSQQDFAASTALSTSSEKMATRYKLFFVGEVMGFEWAKNQAQRSLILQCADPSNYWDYAYQWTNTDLFGPGIKAMFSGGSTNLFTDFLSTSAEVITNILRTPSITFPELKGLAGGIVHLLEAIGGSYYYDKKIAGQNIFFTLAELRLHINQMIVAIEKDPTTERLLAIQGYSGLMSRLLGGMGGQTSIRQSVTAMQGIIFHETYAQPCPRYIPGTINPSTAAGRTTLKDDPSTAFVSTAAEGAIAALKDIKLELHVADNKPGLHVLAAKPKIQGGMRAALNIRLKKLQQELKGVVVRMGKEVKQPPAPRASSLMSLAAQKIGTAASLLRAWSPNNTASIAKVETPVDAAINALSSVINMAREVASKAKPTPPRLAQQILRPDIWFSAPPRCNVLFPEHYSNLSYRRSFMEEPTRLMLKTNDEFFGEDELFDRLYFAPKTVSVKSAKATLTSMLQNDLLNHELYTGILPVFEKMGELNIFAARGGVVKDRVPQVGLAQRSANFLYFKYRFAARQMTVSGRFNPYIAVGFPGLVIDKYVDIETLKLHNELAQKAGQAPRDINTLLGTSFLGNFTQVTFNVNQANGSTDIVMSYPRQPEESVEFLGATEGGTTVVNKRFDKDVTRTTDVASIGQPSIGSLGPNLGVITDVEDVSTIYQGAFRSGDATGSATDKMSSKPLLLFSKQTAQQPKSPASRKSARVPVGVEQDARYLDETTLVELGIRTDAMKKQDFYAQPRLVTIRAYRVTEDVPRYRQDVVDLPAEEYIRPGWYGDIWHPAKIGEAYQTFFATGAITDPHQVVDNASAEAMDRAAVTDDPNNPDKTAPLEYMLNAGCTIEQAAAFLQATYSHIKQHGLDVEEFIRAYTWRPIATMVDMFGTRDLALSADGAYVTKGIEGFHSRAFGPWNDLFGLVTPEIQEVVGLKRGSTSAQKGDTRKAKQTAVKDYLAGLGLGRAIIG